VAAPIAIRRSRPRVPHPGDPAGRGRRGSGGAEAGDLEIGNHGIPLRDEIELERAI
jgi:hypothetical protein